MSRRTARTPVPNRQRPVYWDRHAPGSDRRARCARAQPQERHGRVPARPPGGHHGPVSGQRQVEPRVRHDLRRGPAPLRREPQRVRPAVPGPDGEAGRRPDRRAVARRSRSTRRARAATRGPPSAPSPRSTTTCGCCSRASASRTARTATRSSGRPSSRSSTRCSRCRRARGCSSSGRSSRTARPRATGSSRQRAKQGFVRVRVDGETYDLAEAPTLDKYKRHTIEVVVDRFVVRRAEAPEGGRATTAAGRSIPRPARPSTIPDRPRLADSIETALRLGEGVVLIAPAPREGEPPEFEERRYSERYSCPYDGTTIDELEPRSFSFNSPHGACPTCTGLGTRLEIDPDARPPGPRQERR